MLGSPTQSASDQHCQLAACAVDKAAKFFREGLDALKKRIGSRVNYHFDIKTENNLLFFFQTNIPSDFRLSTKGRLEPICFSLTIKPVVKARENVTSHPYAPHFILHHADSHQPHKPKDHTIESQVEAILAVLEEAAHKHGVLLSLSPQAINERSVARGLSSSPRP